MPNSILSDTMMMESLLSVSDNKSVALLFLTEMGKSKQPPL